MYYPVPQLENVVQSDGQAKRNEKKLFLCHASFGIFLCVSLFRQAVTQNVIFLLCPGDNKVLYSEARSDLFLRAHDIIELYVRKKYSPFLFLTAFDTKKVDIFFSHKRHFLWAIHDS